MTGAAGSRTFSGLSLKFGCGPADTVADGCFDCPDPDSEHLDVPHLPARLARSPGRTGPPRCPPPAGPVPRGVGRGRGVGQERPPPPATGRGDPGRVGGGCHPGGRRRVLGPGPHRWLGRPSRRPRSPTDGADGRDSLSGTAPARAGIDAGTAPARAGIDAGTAPARAGIDAGTPGPASTPGPPATPALPTTSQPSPGLPLAGQAPPQASVPSPSPAARPALPAAPATPEAAASAVVASPSSSPPPAAQSIKDVLTRPALRPPGYLLQVCLLGSCLTVP